MHAADRKGVGGVSMSLAGLVPRASRRSQVEKAAAAGGGAAGAATAGDAAVGQTKQAGTEAHFSS